MFRPAIQRLSILLFMCAFCMFLAIVSMHYKVVFKKDGYDYKINASRLMERSLQKIKKDDKEIDSSYDPLETGVVYFKNGLEGNLDSKLTTLNPNFAGLVVDMFIKANLEEGDNIAVAFTGSMPGANLAVLSACEAMNIKPTIITSVSASNWGANDYGMSWLDMERKLSDYKYYRSDAASVGKGGDIGNGLSEKDIKAIIKSIDRNNISKIYNKKKNLDFHISERMKLYDRDYEDIDLFVNVGGGVASIGYYPGIEKQSGFLSVDSIRFLYSNKVISDCVMKRFAYRKNNPVPSVNITNIEALVGDDLPIISLAKDENNNPVFSKKNSPVIGKGPLFSEKRYNLVIVIPCLIASLTLVLGVGFYSHFQIKQRMTSYDPDSF